MPRDEEQAYDENYFLPTEDELEYAGEMGHIPGRGTLTTEQWRMLYSGYTTETTEEVTIDMEKASPEEWRSFLRHFEDKLNA